MNYRLSRNLEYALMALGYMSLRGGSWISVREMAESLGCPFDPFSRVMQNLVNAGWVLSRKGVGGGYHLGDKLDDFSLYDLMRVILNPVEIASCLSGHCDLSTHCNIQTPIQKLNKRFMDFYKSISITELLGLKRPVGKQRKNRSHPGLTVRF